MENFKAKVKYMLENIEQCVRIETKAEFILNNPSSNLTEKERIEIEDGVKLAGESKERYTHGILLIAEAYGALVEYHKEGGTQKCPTTEDSSITL